METNNIKQYTKASLITSKRYIRHRDLLKVLLDEETVYTFEEVDQIIDNFLNKEVK